MTYSARALAMVVLGMLVLAGCAKLPELGGLTSMLRGGRSARTNELPRSLDGALSIDHLQFKGSHNSYHRAPRLALVKAWRYTHAPLEVQLATQGVRQIELDIRYDKGELLVGHLPFIDGRTNCRRFTDCLERLKHWSKANPTHLPVFVFIEPKEDLAPSQLDGRVNTLDAAIHRVFSRDSLLLPTDVAGEFPSLREAVMKKGWPSVESTRGKFAFVLFGPERHRHAYARYRPRLEGRAMFVAGDPHMPYASVLNYDDPVALRGPIEQAVKHHFLVRTRADSGLVRSTKRRDAALESGAHFVGSDFVDPRHGWVELGTRAPVRCNPVSAPSRCSGSTIAEIEEVRWAWLSPFPAELTSGSQSVAPSKLTSGRQSVR